MDDVFIKMLRRAPLLSNLDSDLVEQVAQSGRLLTLKGRHRRIGQVDLSRRLYFVVSGEMRMLRVAPDGQEQLLQRFRAGEFFCLAAVASGHSCNSVMVNAGTTDLIYWGHDTFRAFLDQNPEFHHNVLSQMAFQIEQEREMRTLSRCCRADVRVAAYLLHRIRNGHCLRQCLCAVDIRPVSLTAQELGLARETLSRCIQRLVKRRAISYERGMIRVTDPVTLEAVLEESECECQCVQENNECVVCSNEFKGLSVRI